MNRPRVLVVDDYADAREMYREYLEFCGFEVVEAVDGIQAVRFAVETQPDIVVMDLSLPVMDGQEAARRIKAHSDTAHIPIIALTGLSAGARAYGIEPFAWDGSIAKPCLPDDLVMEIRRVLDAISGSR